VRCTPPGGAEAEPCRGGPGQRSADDSSDEVWQDPPGPRGAAAVPCSGPVRWPGGGMAGGRPFLCDAHGQPRPVESASAPLPVPPPERRRPPDPPPPPPTAPSSPSPHPP